MASKTDNKPSNDLGFGTSTGDSRNLKKDGSFNVKYTGVSSFALFDLFYELVSMKWWKFITWLVLSFVVLNTFFAFLYFIVGMEHLTGIQGDSAPERFIEAFFFSSQTLTTLGYGRVAPVGFASSFVATVESMLGLLAFAVATGLLYGRFSRPRNRVRYTERAIIAPYKNINAFMFRLAHFSRNQLIEVEGSVNLSWHPEGEPVRKFIFLELERDKVNFLPTTWTIVHPIDEHSPLYKMDKAALERSDVEFIAMIKAYDQTSGQMVYSRASYRFSEIDWGKKFVLVTEVKLNGQRVLNLGRLNETTDAKLNQPL